MVSSLRVGGAESLAVRLAAEQREAGREASLLALEGGPLADACGELAVPLRVIEKRSGLDPSLYSRLAREIRGSEAAVVHTHNSLALIYGAPAARLAGAAVVHTKHGNRLERARRMWLRRAVSRWAHVFVSVSEATDAFAREHREAPVSRMRVIENGVRLASFGTDSTRRAAARTTLGLRPDAWVVGTVGRLEPVKNHALLLRAAAPLLRTGAVLVLVGDGSLRGALESLADTLGCRASIHFAGERVDVPSLLPALDVFALSSDSEGLPLVLLEAMASGLAVASTAVGGIPRVVVPEETAALVPPGDEEALAGALAELRADPTRVAAMGRAGRERVAERYSLAETARAYERLYDSLVS